MDVSVIIPTRARPRKLAACLRALARQTLPADRYEILVGFDGPDPESAEVAREAWREAAGPRGTLHLIDCPPDGYNAARNRLIARARAEFIVSLNDDVRPEPQLLEVHAREQKAAIDRRRPAIITGYSPFVVPRDDTLFDRLVRETSMVFFYDRMLVEETSRGGAEDAEREDADRVRSPSHRLTASPSHDWGFRHCWGLNFSCPLGLVREVGRFTAISGAYGYDDLELAWRLRERFAMPVLFRPEARAEHDHRYTPREVLDRGRRLGASAWRFAEINPGFCREVFGREVRADAEVSRAREFVARDAPLAPRLEVSFRALAELPADAMTGAKGAMCITEIYEHHMLLKRHIWRCGLLDAAIEWRSVPLDAKPAALPATMSRAHTDTLSAWA